jgi:hypothetical protein
MSWVQRIHNKIICQLLRKRRYNLSFNNFIHLNHPNKTITTQDLFNWKSAGRARLCLKLLRSTRLALLWGDLNSFPTLHRLAHGSLRSKPITTVTQIRTTNIKLLSYIMWSAPEGSTTRSGSDGSADIRASQWVSALGRLRVRVTGEEIISCTPC